VTTIGQILFHADLFRQTNQLANKRGQNVSP